MQNLIVFLRNIYVVSWMEAATILVIVLLKGDRFTSVQFMTMLPSLHMYLHMYEIIAK